MKTIIISTLFIFVRGTIDAQTGIGTASPAQQLHVTGPVTTTTGIGSRISLVTPTIRIEGLNKTNNMVASNSTSVVQYVSATQDGDLILSPEFILPLVSPTLGTDMIPTPVTLNTASDPNGQTAQGNLRTYTFTLNQTCMVHFLASVSATVLNSTGGVLTDQVNRIYGVAFELTQVPSLPAPLTINTARPFGADMPSYTNGPAPLPGLDGFSGQSYLQPESYLVLPPGTYTVVLMGWLYSGNYSFRCIFGQASNDMVSIIATPL